MPKFITDIDSDTYKTITVEMLAPDIIHIIQGTNFIILNVSTTPELIIGIMQAVMHNIKK